MTQPISWNEIQDRATAFTKEWAGTSSEEASAKPFWIAFFEVFGIQQRKVSVFEHHVAKLNNALGKIDLFWPGTLVIEHKSLGKDLKKASKQAFDYLHGVESSELPRYVLVCDFEHFVLHDLEAPEGSPAVHSFKLAQLADNIHLFGFIAGYQVRVIRENDPINQEAVVAIGELHDALKRDNYTGEKLEVFLVRLLFCLFADDTGIFQPKDSFHDLIEYHTKPDGSDVGGVLEELFNTLNDKAENRQSRLPHHFAIFPYVNGKLFETHYRPPSFDTAMRSQLLTLCGLDWGSISPAIFGAMFQTVIELDASNRRRQLGAHYTSEANILKLLGPLFLDELRVEFESVKGNKNQLFEFHKRLRELTFLDPACGCGNFLVIAYRTLRELELDVLQAAAKFGQKIGKVFNNLQVNVDQFYGIEIEEFPAQIAQVAMWLTDHQMNVRVGVAFGEHFDRIPLTKSAQIRRGNALEIDWAEFVPPEKLSFIVGNPPFIGSKILSPLQKTSLESVTQGIGSAGILDFVAGWFIKAGQYISATPDGFGGIAAKTNKGRKGFTDVKFGQNQSDLAGFGGLFADVIQVETQARRKVRCAFVSTNSITQGEQVGVLWAWMLAQGIHIHFAHRTFQWSNDAPGKAAVHCVIIGFGMETRTPRLFGYEDIKGSAHEIQVKNVNPYLVDAPTVLLPNRNKPICNVPEIGIGNKPIDDGNYLFTTEERDQFLKLEPNAKTYFKRWIGAQEFLNGSERWCLWLGDCKPNDLASMPEALKRVETVKKFRLASKSKPTQKLAETPTRFHVENIPKSSALLIPRVSSERRAFIPMGILLEGEFTSDTSLLLPNSNIYEFGILSSTMHNAWVRYTCGRLKSDFRYSAGIVYNNYPWPQKPSDKLREAVETAAQGVLDARAEHQTGANPASLATLYNPSTMPTNLQTAHKALDKAVDAAYGVKSLKTDAERVAYLFELYEKYTSLLV
jgi:N-6 DNA Methylase